MIGKGDVSGRGSAGRGAGEERGGRNGGRGGRGGNGSGSKLCSYYRVGECNKGSACMFQHAPCRSVFATGTCDRRDCFFGHSAEWAAAIQAVVPQNRHPPTSEDLSTCAPVIQKAQSDHLGKINKLSQKIEVLEQEAAVASLDIKSRKYEEIRVVKDLKEVSDNQLRVFNEAIEHIRVSSTLYSKGARVDREARRLAGGLPFFAFRDRVVETVQSYNVSIIIGETGSGKINTFIYCCVALCCVMLCCAVLCYSFINTTSFLQTVSVHFIHSRVFYYLFTGKSTQIAPYLLDAAHTHVGTEDIASGKIVVTQPRNLAASELAKRVSFEWYGKTSTFSIIGKMTQSKKKVSILFIVV
jgi:hypothetical protein